jgi:tetratricopeptide (TPR) repeat protein
MKQGLAMALVAASCVMAAGLACAQNPPAQNQPGQSQPGQNPPAKTAPKQPANAFPEDTSKVPVMPSKDTPALPPETYDGDAAAGNVRVPLRSDGQDPVRSPDDAQPETSGATELQPVASDSRSGLDKIVPGPDDDQPERRRRKGDQAVPEHQETAKEDINVGGYYLETKNWRAAQSRFESAMVLSPDDPEVYWGLAESARHLGDLAKARGYYQKVAEYDPDSKHGKEAVKLLKDPEIANARAVAPAK